VIRSMTGFGRGEAAGARRKVIVEIKCVNQRYADFNFRLPRDMGAVEEPLRNLLKAAIKRGRVDIFLTLEDSPAGGRNVTVDTDLARRYLGLLTQLCEDLALTDAVRLEHLLRLPDVVVAGQDEQDQDELQDLALLACGDALGRLVAMREREGQAMRADLKARLAKLAEFRSEVSGKAGQLVGLWRDRLMARLTELAPAVLFDPSRLEQEVALYADRSDISEELVRLASHIQQMHAALDSVDGEAVGRRLDFICQEMLREVNTVGSKALDSEIASGIIAAKEELEKIREQLQNIE